MKIRIIFTFKISNFCKNKVLCNPFPIIRFGVIDTYIRPQNETTSKKENVFTKSKTQKSSKYYI